MDMEEEGGGGKGRGGDQGRKRETWHGRKIRRSMWMKATQEKKEGGWEDIRMRCVLQTHDDEGDVRKRHPSTSTSLDRRQEECTWSKRRKTKPLSYLSSSRKTRETQKTCNGMEWKWWREGRMVWHDKEGHRRNHTRDTWWWCTIHYKTALCFTHTNGIQGTKIRRRRKRWNKSK